MLVFFLACGQPAEPLAPPPAVPIPEAPEEPPAVEPIRLPHAPADLAPPEASAAARPPWAVAVPAPEELMGKGESGAAARTGGMLACHITSIQSDGFFDKSGQDLEGTLTLGERTVTWAGEDDTAAGIATVPLAQTAEGMSVTVSVSDRESRGLREVGSLSLSLSGFPARILYSPLELQCVYVPREGLEALLAPILEEAVAALQGWDQRGSLTEHPLPTGTAAELPVLISRAAVLVGWADPRVAALAGHYTERITMFQAPLAAAVDGQLTRLGAPAMVVLGEGAGAGPASLVPAEQMARRGDWGVAIRYRPDGGSALHQTVLVDRDGRGVRLQAIDRWDELWLYRGEGPLPKLPALMRMEIGEAVFFQRVGEPDPDQTIPREPIPSIPSMPDDVESTEKLEDEDEVLEERPD